jgi:hypothetical protein
MNIRSFLLTLTLTTIAAPGMAATCDESFQKKGDFFNGSAFSARVQVEGLTTESAFAQLRPILARESIKTLSTDIAGGVMRAENPATAFQRALPIDVYTTQEGSRLNVEMVFTLPSGVGAKKDTVKGYLCGALNQLKPPTSTEPATPKVDLSKAIDIDGITLAKQVKDAGDNPARIRLNFIGKTFRITGKVLTIADSTNGYLVTVDGGPLGNSPTAKAPRMALVCTMAKNQDAAVAALQLNRPATLIGLFQGFDTKANTIQLQGCTGR